MRVAVPVFAAFALAANSPAAEREVRAVRLTTLDFRTAVRVLTSDDVPPGEVVREGDEVVIRLAGTAPVDLAPPPLEKPLEAIRIDREPGVTVVRVKVAPEIPFEGSYEPGLLTVVFGEQPAPELRGPVTPELYQLLFPTGSAAQKSKRKRHPSRAAARGSCWGRPPSVPTCR